MSKKIRYQVTMDGDAPWGSKLSDLATFVEDAKGFAIPSDTTLQQERSQFDSPCCMGRLMVERVEVVPSAADLRREAPAKEERLAVARKRVEEANHEYGDALEQVCNASGL